MYKEYITIFLLVLIVSSYDIYTLIKNFNIFTKKKDKEVTDNNDK